MAGKKLQTVVVVLIAVAFAPLAITNMRSWRGEVFLLGAGDWIPGVTVVLLSGNRVVQTATTDANGEFDLDVGFARDSSHRLILCKPGYEPSGLFERPMRRTKAASGSGRPRYGLNRANLQFEAEHITQLKAVLPAACR